MKKIFLSFLLTLSFLLPAFSAFAEEPAETAEPVLQAETAILIDAASGRILYEKNADQKMYPASITKLMTILLALENGSLTDELTFSHDAVYSIEQGSAHIAIQEGETLTLEQVLRAIILRSANEASNGVAEYVDGSIDAFAKHMTERAKELGAENTNFVNANGLHDENHYTTAHDMALIARQLLTIEDYRNMMSETYYEIPPTNKQTETRYLHGQHQMLNPNSLYYYEDAIGGKTGYTTEALNTLVTYAERDGMELIAVVMKCNGAEHYTDTAALFDYGFANYENKQLLSASAYDTSVLVTETVKDTAVERGSVTVSPAEDVYAVLKKGTDISALELSADCPETITAPVIEGQEIGTLTLSLDGEVLQTVALTAKNAVSAMTAEELAAYEKTTSAYWVKKIGLGFGIFLLCLLVLFCITRTIGYLRYQKRRKRRKHRIRNYRNRR